MRVAAVRQGSPAAVNGIRAGDILLGLHGWETINEDNLAYVLDYQAKNKVNPVEFFVFRSGRPLWGRMKLTN